MSYSRINRIYSDVKDFQKNLNEYESDKYKKDSLKYKINKYTRALRKTQTDKIVEPVSQLWEGIDPETRENIVEGVSAAGASIQEWNKNRRKISPSGLGPLDPFIGLGHVVNWATTGIADVTGIDEGTVAIAESFVPYGTIFSKFSKTAQILKHSSKFKTTARTIDVGSDIAKLNKTLNTYSPGLKGAFQAQSRMPFGTTDFTEFSYLQGDVAHLFKDNSKVAKYISAFDGPKQVNINTWQKALTDITGTGDKMRKASAVFLTSGLGPPNYQQFGLYTSKATGGAVRIAKTNIHHTKFLEKSKRIAIAHSSFQPIVDASKRGIILESPIVVGLEKRGIKLGNYAENVTDVFETLTLGSRNFKTNTVFDQFGGTLNRQTINDLFQGSWMDKGIKDISAESIKELESFQKIPGKRGSGFPRDQLETVSGKDNFPKIRINDLEGNLIEEWKPQNWDDWENRFQIVSDKLGIENKYNRKAIKIPSDADIFSNDHSLVHSLTEKLEVTPGNPIYEANQAGFTPQTLF